eukprot:UN02048
MNDNADGENVTQPKITPTSQAKPVPAKPKEKKSKIKKQPTPPKPIDENHSALLYLDKFGTEEFKFNKAKQAWLMRRWTNTDVMSDERFEKFLVYIKPVQGGHLQLLYQNARDLMNKYGENLPEKLTKRLESILDLFKIDRAFLKTFVSDKEKAEKETKEKLAVKKQEMITARQARKLERKELKKKAHEERKAAEKALKEQKLAAKAARKAMRDGVSSSDSESESDSSSSSDSDSDSSDSDSDSEEEEQQPKKTTTAVAEKKQEPVKKNERRWEEESSSSDDSDSSDSDSD